MRLTMDTLRLLWIAATWRGTYGRSARAVVRIFLLLPAFRSMRKPAHHGAYTHFDLLVFGIGLPVITALDKHFGPDGWWGVAYVFGLWMVWAIVGGVIRDLLASVRE